MIVKLFLVTKILLRNSTITLLVLVTQMVIIFSDSSAFENFMSSDNLGEHFKFSTVNLESVEAIVDSLKNSSPGHNEIHISISKEFFLLLGPVMLKNCNKSLEQGKFPDSL